MKRKNAEALQATWGGDPCDHPKLARLYDKGVATGEYGCAQCGRIFTFRERAELVASRREG